MRNYIIPPDAPGTIVYHLVCAAVNKFIEKKFTTFPIIGQDTKVNL